MLLGMPRGTPEGTLRGMFRGAPQGIFRRMTQETSWRNLRGLPRGITFGNTFE